ncbi:MAG TPA: hypothetical protein VFT78_02180 [Hanamia sp.]|nr:hypothetical protein [Hanamia sp.]
MKRYMTGIFAMIIGTALAFGTSAFKNANVNHDGEEFWVLKSGTIASTNPADYKLGTDNCEQDVHFCGFYAPDDGTGKPQIPSGSALRSDLSNLSMDNNTAYNTSGDISFKDPN